MGDPTNVTPLTTAPQPPQRFHRPARRVPVRLPATNHGARFQAVHPEAPMTLRSRLEAVREAAPYALALALIVAAICWTFVMAWDKEIAIENRTQAVREAFP